MMGLHVIEEARLAGVKKLVVLGTVCAYPKFVPIPFREENLWDGFPEETNAPYAIAKKALLMQCQAYREQYGISAIYLLPANLYGPGDNFDLEKSHVIPALVRKMVEAGEANAPTVKAWGTGKASREFLYVEDCVEGILAAAERYDGGEPVNLGTGAEISIRDLASLIAVLADYDGRILWDADQPDGQPRRCLDTSRAKRYFGWEALTPLKEGLAKTIAWYREERKRGNP
jgi:GDP-L-fucose synthase